MDCAEADMLNIMHFTTRMVALATFRHELGQYLQHKMHDVAPNLSTLVGDAVGARLISKAGSLSSLAKCPASTVQILGAEKALFRALKKKGNTPKYGLIYHSTFIGRAQKKNKGRISRYLANKCAMASRIDAFADDLTDKYGEQMREQVEERLRFFDTGAQPRKNIDVMNQVKADLGAVDLIKQAAAESDAAPVAKKEKKKKKKKRPDDDAAEEEEEQAAAEKPKKKKRKKTEDAADDEGPPPPTSDDPPKKKKKKKAPVEADDDAAAAAATTEKKKKKKKKSEAPATA